MIHLPIGANVSNGRFPLPVIFGIEVLASGLLMVIFAVGLYKRIERI
jgi:hypothetical protein